MTRPGKPGRGQMLRWGALSMALVLSSAATALDLGKWGQKLKNLDVDKVVDVGKRLVEGTTMMPEDQEIALGRDLAARLLGAMPPLDAPAVQAFVNRLGLYLALQTDRPDLPWQFIVTDSDSVGAFATPGGNVVITAGLLRLMRDEHELAGVLAHEIQHVVERHHLKAIMAAARVDLAKELAADMARSYSGNPVVADALLGAGVKLYTAGLDQGDEFQADELGTITAAGAGYDPTGLVLLLTTLDSIDAGEPRLSLLMSTHPPTRERIDRLAVVIEGFDLAPDTTLLDAERFNNMQAGLFAAD